MTTPSLSAGLRGGIVGMTEGFTLTAQGVKQ